MQKFKFRCSWPSWQDDKRFPWRSVNLFWSSFVLNQQKERKRPNRASIFRYNQDR